MTSSLPWAPATGRRRRRASTSVSRPGSAPPLHTWREPDERTLGRVSIVGAGPGDPELITVRALARIRSAEVLVYDRLVDPALIDEAPPTAERVFAGKARGFAALEQREIEALLIARALAGKHVVRLKGGDPYVFGRGGEEVASLVAAGIPVEVVPGVSSATGGSGQRRHSGDPSRALLVADDRHRSRGSDEAGGSGRLGLAGGIAGHAGDPDGPEPAARHPRPADRRWPLAGYPRGGIAGGTRPDQRVVTASLADLPEVVAAAQLVAPALVVVGDVVRCRELLAPSALNGAPVTAAASEDSRVEPGPAVFAPAGSLSSHLSGNSEIGEAPGHEIAGDAGVAPSRSCHGATPGRPAEALADNRGGSNG